MSSIDTVRDKNGRAIKFRARWRTPDGASRSQTFKLKAAAEQHLASVTTSVATGAYVDSRAQRVKFREVAEAWVAAQPHRASTAASVRSILDSHVLPAFGDRAIGSIRPSEVQGWVAGLRSRPSKSAPDGKPMAPSTVTVVYGKLAAIFAAAVEDRLIARSPCTRRIRLPRPEGSEVTPMDPSEVRAMMAAVGDRYAALVVTLAGSGLRPAEGLGLTVDRVDFLRRTIRVDRQLVTITGERPVLAAPKTRSSVRTIPVPAAVTDAIAAHLKQFGEGPGRLIFTDDKGDPIRRNALGHQWRRAAAKAKVVDRTPHDLRHYAASVLIHQGASVKAVQKHLGHASAKTTLDTYAHLWPDSEDITRRALDAGLAQIVSPGCHAEAADT